MPRFLRSGACKTYEEGWDGGGRLSGGAQYANCGVQRKLAGAMSCDP